MSGPNLVSDRTPLKSLLIILFNLFLGFVVVGPVLGLAVASLFYEGELLLDMQDPENHPGIAVPVLIMQGIGALIALIVFPLIQLVAIEHKSIQPFFPRQKETPYILMLLMILGITFVVSINPLIEWNRALKFPEFFGGFETWAKKAEETAAKITELMTTFESPWDFLIGLLVIALLPAIGEELMFRGLFQNELFRATRNVHTAIWVSAIIFSAVHMQFYGFVPRLLLGALFGYLYYWSGNLLIPMFAHFFNNAFGITMIYLYRQEITTLNMEESMVVPPSVVMLNLALTIGLLYYIWKHYRDLPKRDSNFFGQHSDSPIPD